MKCPYNIEITQICQSAYFYKDEDKIASVITGLSEQHRFTECLKEECAAYKNGECTYKGG